MSFAAGGWEKSLDLGVQAESPPYTVARETWGPGYPARGRPHRAAGVPTDGRSGSGTTEGGREPAFPASGLQGSHQELQPGPEADEG